MRPRFACAHVHVLVPALALALTALAAPLARSAAPSFPDTPAGRHARDFFPAFASDEGAMRAYWLAHATTAALAARPVAVRLDVWRQMREEHGTLTPLEVVTARADLVEVRVRDEHGDRFRIGFACDADSAHGLVALRVEDDVAAGGDRAGGAPGAAPVPDAGPPPTDAQIVRGLAAALDSLTRAGEFSGTALLDKDGTTLYAHAFGMASRAGNAPMRLDSRLDLGSINKLFTMVAIQQLDQAGKLSLDDTIDRWLPDYPAAAARKITVRMLLEHRSGVPDVLHDPALWKDPGRVRTMADWYALIRPRPLDFAPGSQQAYSNGGYVLLGEIVARAAGEDYYAYVRRHIYAPCGMARSDHYANDERVEGLATGYVKGEPPAPGIARDPDGRFANAPRPIGRGSSAGGGFSTAPDLLRFARALRAGHLLDREHTRRIVGEGPGLGIAGGSPGVNALLELEGPYTLVVLSNYDPPAAERFTRLVGGDLRRAAGMPAREGARSGAVREERIAAPSAHAGADSVR